MSLSWGRSDPHCIAVRYHLFDVMNDEEGAEWHMELLVEEKRMGHITRAIQDRVKSGGTAELEGDFTMVSLPESKFRCNLTTIATRSTTDPELGTAFELIAKAAEGQEIPIKRIGTEVTVRLYCGECTLAFYMFGDVVEFIQRQFWWF